jgi:hypothetical protein
MVAYPSGALYVTNQDLYRVPIIQCCQTPAPAVGDLQDHSAPQMRPFEF